MNDRWLPRGWTEATIGDLVDRLQYGLTAKAVASRQGPRFLRITDLDSGRVDWSTVPGCDLSKADLDKYRLIADDIVFARTGSIEKAARIINPPDAVFASYLIRGRPVVREIAGWLGLFVGSYSYVNQAKKLSAGIGRANVNAQNLAKVRIALPPVFEQKRIVEIVDSYLTRLDAAVASLESVQAKLNAYRASVLKAAVDARLVPTEASLARAQKRNYEHAEGLMARTVKERRRRWEEAELAGLNANGKAPKDDTWKTKYVEPVALDTSTLPELPEGWCWAGAFHLCTAIGDVDHKMPSEADSGVPYVSTRNFHGFNEIDFAGAKLISLADFEQLSRKIQPQHGDILLSRYGTVGEVRLVETEGRFQASYSISILKPVEVSLSRYISYALRSAPLQSQMRNHTRATAQPDLGLRHIRELAIPLPPFAEQERIIGEVDRLFSIASKLDAMMATQESRCRKLRHSVLKWAFEGKLVDQDQSDEPAERLFARIRAERAASAPTKKSRGRAAKGAA